MAMVKLQLDVRNVSLLLAVMAAMPLGGFLFSTGQYGHASIAMAVSGLGVMYLLLRQQPAPRSVKRRVVTTARRVPYLMSPSSARVVEIAGKCAQGYSRDDHWTVDHDGLLDRPLCRPALFYLLSELRIPDSSGQVGEILASCRCPLSQGKVTFSIRQE